VPFKFNPFTHKLDITDVGGGGTGILSITGNSGGAVSADGSNNIELVGTGAITVSGSPGTNTLTIGSSNPFFTWSVISSNQMAISQQGYFVDAVGQIEVALPLISGIGDIFTIADLGGNGWRITQAAGQQVLLGIDSTTVGASGYIQSTFICDSVTLVCCEVNLTWMVIPASGNITIV